MRTLHLYENENHLIGKTAGLLHVTHGEYIAAKMRAKEAAGRVEPWRRRTQGAAISYRVPLPCPVRSSKPASTRSVSSRYAVARDTPAIATYFSVLMPPL